MVGPDHAIVPPDQDLVSWDKTRRHRGHYSLCTAGRRLVCPDVPSVQANRVLDVPFSGMVVLKNRSRVRSGGSEASYPPATRPPLHIQSRKGQKVSLLVKTQERSPPFFEFSLIPSCANSIGRQLTI